MPHGFKIGPIIALRDLKPGQTVILDDDVALTVTAVRRQGSDMMWILETNDGAMTIPLPGETLYELATEQLSLVAP